MATASDICTLCEPTSPSISKESRLDSITVEQPEKFKSIVKPNKKMKLESAFQPTPKHCIPTCKRKNYKDIIRCMRCMMWAHLKCVGEASDYMGVWSCFDCHSETKITNNILNNIQDMISEIVGLNTAVADVGYDVVQLKQTISTLNAHVCEMKMCNNELSTKVDTGTLLSENEVLKSELTLLSNKGYHPDETLHFGRR